MRKDETDHLLRGVYRHFQTFLTAFQALDLSGDHILSKTEMRKAMELFGQPISSAEDEQKFEAAFSRADEDGSGQIELAEFIWLTTEMLHGGGSVKAINDTLRRFDLLKTSFVALDRNNRGTLDLRDLQAATELFGPAMSDAELQELVNLVDINQNGTIEFIEYVELMTRLLTEKKNNGQLSTTLARFDKYEEKITSLRVMFDKFDVDGDGELCPNELEAAMSLFGLENKGSELQELFEEMDTDHNGSLDFGEFATAMVRKMKYVDSEQFLQTAFSRFDSDGSGAVSPEELRRLLDAINKEKQVVTEAEINQMIEDADKDGDHEISFTEFIENTKQRGKLLQALDDAAVMANCLQVIREVMLERFYRMIFDKGMPLKRAFNQWNAEAQARKSLSTMSDRLDEYIIGGGSTSKDFSGLSLQTKKFQGRILTRAKFIGARCQEAIFTNATLDRTNFYRAQLEEAEFEGANLRDADLSRARLTGANFRNAKLRDTNFDGATLEAAIVNGVQLPGAIFSNVVYTPYRMVKEKAPPPKVTFIQAIQRDGCKAIKSGFFGALGGDGEEGGDEEDDDDEDEDEESDTEDEDEEEGGKKGSWTAMVNMALDMKLGALIGAGKKFIKQAEQLRQNLLAEAEKLEAETAVYSEKALLVIIHGMAKGRAVTRLSPTDLEKELSKEAEKLVTKAVQDKVVKPLFNRTIPRLIDELERALIVVPPPEIKDGTLQSPRAGFSIRRKASRVAPEVAPIPAAELVSVPTWQEPMEDQPPTSDAVHTFSKQEDAVDFEVDEDQEDAIDEDNEAGEEEAEEEPEAEEEGEGGSLGKGMLDNKAVQLIVSELIQLLREALQPESLASKLSLKELKQSTQARTQKLVKPVKAKLLDKAQKAVEQWSTTTVALVQPLMPALTHIGTVEAQEAKREIHRLMAGVKALLSKVTRSLGDMVMKSIKDCILEIVLTQTSKFGRPMKVMQSRFNTFQKKLLEGLDKDATKGDAGGGTGGDPSMLSDMYTSKNQFANKLNKVSTSRVGLEALKMISEYDIYVGGMAFSPGSVWTALRTPAKELRRDHNELTYMADRLKYIEQITLSTETWRDYTEAWDTLLALRRKILAKRGHAVLRCISTDLKVISGLGAAMQMINVAGEVPNEVLNMLNEGPAAHLNRHAFQYHKIIDKELFGIQRVRDIKRGAAQMVSGAIVAAMIGAFNQLFERLFGILFDSVSTDAADGA